MLSHGAASDTPEYGDLPVPLMSLDLHLEGHLMRSLTVSHVFFACSSGADTPEAAVAATSTGVQAPIDLLGIGVWQPLLSAISAQLPSMFAAGMADTLHTNYSLSQGLLERLVTACNLALNAHNQYAPLFTS